MGERLERLWPSLVALVGVVAVVLVLLWQFGDDADDSTPDDVAAGETPAETPATEAPTGEPTEAPTEDPTEDPTDPVTAPPELREEIGVVNQTDVEGLAEFAQERFEEGGWDVPATGPFTGTVPETTVYFPDGMQEAAEALAAQFPEIGRVEPTFEGLNPNRLVVVLVEDFVDEVGEPE